jgi:hypothetical protein
MTGFPGESDFLYSESVTFLWSSLSMVSDLEFMNHMALYESSVAGPNYNL